jgi:hypothetical protein
MEFTMRLFATFRVFEYFRFHFIIVLDKRCPSSSQRSPHIGKRLTENRHNVARSTACKIDPCRPSPQSVIRRGSPSWKRNFPYTVEKAAGDSARQG